MGVKNVKNCSLAQGNTGVGACWNDVGIPRAILFVPINKIYPTSTLAAFKAAIEADILADIAELRVYPVQNIVQIKDNTKAPNEQTFSGDGSTVIVGENAYDLAFQWSTGGFCLHHSLRKSKGQNKAFMIIDSKGQVIATDAGTSVNQEQVKGIIGYNYTTPFTWSSSTSAVAEYSTRLIFRPEQVNENIGLIDFNAEGGGGLAYLESLNGLFNVHTSLGHARALGVVTVKGNLTGCQDTDLYDLYNTVFAVTAAFKVRNRLTKNPLTVTAVADAPTYRGWQVTVSVSDPNYTATAGDLEVSFNGPTELAALTSTVGPDGFESDWLAY